MARKEVLVSICDSCSKEVITDVPLRIAKSDLLLPPDWVVVSVQSAKKDIYTSDLCDECKGPVLTAIGKHHSR